jgi:C4-dicarboxylate transporter DctM subunit
MSPSLVGLLGIIFVLLLMVLNVPVAFAFALVGFAGITYLASFNAAIGSFAGTFWVTASNYVWMALPLFMLLGEFANESDIGEDLYDSASKWLKNLPGGLAIATTWAGAAFAACSGTSTGGITTLGPISYGPMEHKGYDKPLIAGTLCCGATMGIMIPPSLAFIVYAGITGESIGQLFMAGVFPGAMEAILYSVTIILFVKLRIWSAPPGAPSTWKERFVSLKSVWGMLVLMLLVLGGIYLGIFTAIEAGAIGAFGALVIMLVRKGWAWSRIKRGFVASLSTACMIYAIIIGAMVFVHFIAITDLNITLIQGLENLGLSAFHFLLIIISILVVGGFFMPGTALFLLIVPLVYPIIVTHYGYNGVWFGVIITMMAELCSITPPVGINLFVMQSIFPQLSLRDLYKGVTPFIITDLIRVILVFTFPAICLWLPSKMFMAQ